MPEQEPKSSRFTVGYALPQSKLKSFMVPPFINHANEQGIDFVPIDVSKPLTHQGPFNCIIHKLYGHQWNLNLNEFSLTHPNATLIDHPSAIQRLHNRISMLEPVVQLNIPHLNIPNQILLQDPTSLNPTNDLSLIFPVIAKPLLADGSTNAHHMALVLNREGLTKGLELELPMVLQEFVNHGGIIFKVYVAGDIVKCVKRSSLQDISEEKMEKMVLDCGGVMSFSQISGSAMAGDDYRSDVCCDEKVKMPAMEFVVEVAKGLRVGLGLHLFNFDMIRDKKGDGYFVVDINYFPGYEKLPSYETIMTDFFLNIKKSQEEEEEEEKMIMAEEEKKKMTVEEEEEKKKMVEEATEVDKPKV